VVQGDQTPSWSAKVRQRDTQRQWVVVVVVVWVLVVVVVLVVLVVLVVEAVA